MNSLVSDIAIFVLKRDVKLQLTNFYEFSKHFKFVSYHNTATSDMN